MLVTAVFAIFYGMNLYLVTYDSLQEFCSTVLHRRVADSFKQWWHYLDTMYIVADDRNLDDFATYFRSLIRGASFRDNARVFVMELQPGHTNIQGWLPPEAYRWIIKQLDRNELIVKGDLPLHVAIERDIPERLPVPFDRKSFFTVTQVDRWLDQVHANPQEAALCRARLIDIVFENIRRANDAIG